MISSINENGECRSVVVVISVIGILSESGATTGAETNGAAEMPLVSNDTEEPVMVDPTVRWPLRSSPLDFLFLSRLVNLPIFTLLLWSEGRKSGMKVGGEGEERYCFPLGCCSYCCWLRVCRLLFFEARRVKGVYQLFCAL